MSENLKWAALKRAVERVSALTKRLSNGEDVQERLDFWMSRRAWAIAQVGKIEGAW